MAARGRGSRWARRSAGLAAALAAAALTGCGAAAPGAEAAGAGGGGADAPRGVALRGFDSCPVLLRHVRTRAVALTGPYGLRGYGAVPTDVMPATGGVAVPEAAAGAPAADRASGTNVQEAGVDEPDLVKTDGARLFAVADGAVRAVDLTGPAPRQVGTHRLRPGAGAQLLLLGDRLLVIETDFAVREATGSAPAFGTETVRVTALDVADPAAMRPAGTLSIDGRVVSARLTGDAVRLVVSTAPDPLPHVTPAAEGARALARAATRNRRVAARARLTGFVPSYTLRRPARAVVRRLAAPCDEVLAPRRFAGLGMVTVLTLGLDPQLAVRDSDAVMTDGELVYASTGSLYVATPRWFDPSRAGDAEAPPSSRTLVHKLDTSRPDRTEYRASGAVPGFLLNQFSMSEHEGVLRVASTEAPEWWGGGDDDRSESHVSTLAERDGRLETLGRVGGLGRGERIHAVRFLGDRGYVVTFRQTDPLYVVDLADPARPAVRGELKIPGYSAYLHPVGETLLIGVGQDATSEGRTTGTQVSLFDVSDPARPARVAQRRLGAGWSEAEGDHHAFLYWAPTGLLVLPFADAADATREPELGAAALRVRAGEPITELGRLRHPGDDRWRAAIRRSVVAGSALLTISERGILASDLETLAPRGFLRFG